MGQGQSRSRPKHKNDMKNATAINAKTIVQVRLIRNQNNPNLGVGEIGQFVRASDIAGFSLLRFGGNLWFAKDFDFEVVKAI